MVQTLTIDSKQAIPLTVETDGPSPPAGAILITWASSNPAVATVEPPESWPGETVRVIAHRKGTVDITASVDADLMLWPGGEIDEATSRFRLRVRVLPAVDESFTPRPS